MALNYSEVVDRLNPQMAATKGYQSDRLTNFWIKRISVNALPRLTETPDDQSFHSQLQYRSLHVAALQDIEATFDYALSLTGGGVLSPAVPVLSIWSEKDPLAAWERVSVIEETSQQKILTRSLFGHWVTNDAAILMDSLGKFPKDAQDVARVMLIPVLFRDSAERALAMYDAIED